MQFGEAADAGSLEPTPASPRRSLWIAAAVTAAAVGTTQVYAAVVPDLTIDQSLVGYVGIQVVLLVLLGLAVRLEGRPLRDFGFTVRGSVGSTLGFAGILVLTFLALRLDPGFVFGFGKIPLPDVWTFGFLLLTAPLVALAEVGLFFGYLFRSLSRVVSLRAAVFLASGAFALYSTDFLLFPLFGTLGALQYLFTTTMVSFVLGIVLALYVYKSEWSALGAFAFYAATLEIESLLPVGAAFPSWEVSFVASLAASAAVLVIVGLGLKEPRLQALHYLGERVGPRRFRFRQRSRDREGARSLWVTATALGVVGISFGYGLPTVLGTAHPILAIATGSMVPTLERGTLVVIQHVAPTAITVGTIIAFTVSCLPSPTVHRVIRIVHAGPDWVFQTKGDANPVQDPCTVPYSDVLGAVFVIVPFAGLLILDPLLAAAVVILIIVVPMALREPRA